MALMAVPLAVSVLVAQAVFSRAVVSAYDDDATRFEEHVVPAHQLEIAIWEGQTRADQYLLNSEERQLAGYRQVRSLIRSKFASLKHYAQTSAERDSLEHAREDWNRADDSVESSIVAPGVASAKKQEFRNAATASAVADLREIEMSFTIDIRARHMTIAAAHERSKTIAVVAALASTFVFLTSVLLMWRARAMIGRLSSVLKRQSDRYSRLSKRPALKVA
jgi:hypothetical protein